MSFADLLQVVKTFATVENLQQTWQQICHQQAVASHAKYPDTGLLIKSAAKCQQTSHNLDIFLLCEVKSYKSFVSLLIMACILFVIKSINLERL